jgi:hypothetical protein
MTTAGNGSLFMYGTFAWTPDAFSVKPFIHGRRSLPSSKSIGSNDDEVAMKGRYFDEGFRTPRLGYETE